MIGQETGLESVHQSMHPAKGGFVFAAPQEESTS
jgi:hypothetical protein